MDALLGQDHVVAYLRESLPAPPHLMLLGGRGTGKTMAARAFLGEYLCGRGVPAAQHETYVLHCTSVDDRGIAMVRGRLAEFVRRVRPHAGVLAWVFVDDADSLPLVSQQALRRILETHAPSVRFLFCAEGPETFIEPLQSRCVVLQFAPVDLGTHAAALVATHAPRLALDADAGAWLAAMALGNARQYVRFLQVLNAVAAPAEAAAERVPVSAALAQAVVNAPPVRKLRALAEASLARDAVGVARALLDLWSAGYSFEDVAAQLEVTVRTYAFFGAEENQRLFGRVGECHVAMIQNRTRLLDAIAILGAA
jgi:replication factor C small subunit